MLSRQGEVLVSDLAEHFGVAALTIRRDLDALEAEGAVTRTHGGAMRADTGVISFIHAEKSAENLAAKQAIAEAVAQGIEPGMAISLDTGSTTTEVARHICGIPDLTVLTSSLAVASVLYAHSNITLVLLGGQVSPGSPDLTGEMTEENLKRFHVHKAILGADAVSEDGIYSHDTMVARVSRAMVSSGARKVLVADQSKFTKTAFARICGLESIDTLVTEGRLKADVRKRLLGAGVGTIEQAKGKA
jgi:DeoR/GlpR family transcriptional regulator of sugar metabolism